MCNNCADLVSKLKELGHCRKTKERPIGPPKTFRVTGSSGKKKRGWGYSVLALGGLPQKGLGGWGARNTVVWNDLVMCMHDQYIV